MSENKQLSGRSLEVFEFIVAFKRAHDGISPTIREIGDGCLIASSSHVALLLERLEFAGVIERYGGKGISRNIMVVRNGDRSDE